MWILSIDLNVADETKFHLDTTGRRQLVLTFDDAPQHCVQPMRAIGPALWIAALAFLNCVPLFGKFT